MFLVRKGEVITPQVTDGVLEGITRRTVMELLARERGITVVERSVDRTELLLAEEVFLAGTGIGIVPVTRLDNRTVGAGGPGEITGAVRRLYLDAARGKLPAYRSWCQPIFAEKVARPSVVRVA